MAYVFLAEIVTELFYYNIYCSGLKMFRLRIKVKITLSFFICLEFWSVWRNINNLNQPACLNVYFSIPDSP